MKKLYLLLVLLVQVSVVFSQSHFVKGFIGDGYEQMNINFVSATIGATQLEAGDEIAVFDGNLCVGVTLLTQDLDPLDFTTYPNIKASSDDGSESNNGFIPSHKMYFRFWDSSTGTEYHNIIATVSNNSDQPITNEFVSAGLAFVRASAENTTKTWTDLSTTSWDDPDAWDPAGVPEPIHDILIPSGITGPSILAAGSSYCGSLELEDGSNLTINSGTTGSGSLIVASDISGTGVVTSRRYLLADGWHMVSSAVSGQSVAGFLTSNTAIPTKDVTSRGMMEYDESTDNWSNYFTNSSSETVNSGKGYSVRRGTNGIITFLGTLTYGNIDAPVTKNNSGWNLLGNPFTSAMYVRQEVHGFLNVNDAILDPSFKALYLWDPTANGGSGGYTIVNSDEGQANLSSGQGFFVKAASTGNVTFTNAMQVHQTNALFKSAKLPTPFIVLNAKIGNTSGSTKIKFNEEMTLGLDPSYDAGILRSGNGFDIYSKLVVDNGVDFAIQALPGKSTDSYVIPIGIDAIKGGEVVFSAQTLNLPIGYDLMLEDKLNNTQTSIKNGELYIAEIASNSNGAGRFYLHVGASVQTRLQEIEMEDIIVYTINQKLYIKGNVSKEAQFMLYSIDGRLIKQFAATSQNLNQLTIAGFTPGIYIVKVQDKNNYKPVKFVIEN